MDQIRWDALIAHLGVARQKLAAASAEAFPFTVPHLAATPAQLEAAEARLGQPLDPLYRELLSYGNGWPQLAFNGDMLGTDDLGQGPVWDRGQELLDLYFENCDTSDLPPRDHLIPIYVSRHEMDVMVLSASSPVTNGGHEVIWLDTEIADRWDNVLEWWLACIELVNYLTHRFTSNAYQ